MSRWRAFRITVGMVTGKAILILCNAFVNVRRFFNGWSVQAQIVSVGTAIDYREHNTKKNDFYEWLHVSSSEIEPSLRRMTVSAVEVMSLSWVAMITVHPDFFPSSRISTTI